MAQPQLKPNAPTFAEDIRLIIWDLDETFWDGTLTEGGLTMRQDHLDLVKDLAAQGIMSAICSKNDHAQVQDVLTQAGLWDIFIFPSIDWTPKGPRISAMLDQIGLRAQSVLFLDDNPMNLAQAKHANPGLNVSLPDISIELRNHPQLRGKPDPELKRLAQYKVKERKAEAAEIAGGDTINFLRGSNVRVFVDYEVETHLDRAIELINRTNQLNFTKARLPEDLEEARIELREILSKNTTDAALLRVEDNYGDYGYVGFYLSERIHNERHLQHFCFSCRTLNMYIEHWAYQFLGRPSLHIVGEVLTNPIMDKVEVDWITAADIADLDGFKFARQPKFRTIIARGGCDLASLMHYLSLHARETVEEFNHPKNGQMLRRDHSCFLMPVLSGGLSPAQLAAAKSVGYEAEDFRSTLADPPAETDLVFLSFWADADIPVYRHKQTGLRVPYWLVGAQNHDLIAKSELRKAVAKTDLQRARLQVLCRDFVHEGILSDEEMHQRYKTILAALPRDISCVLMLANERGPLHFKNNTHPIHPHHHRLNNVLRRVAGEHRNTLLLNPADHLTDASDLIDLNHFKRPTYHRIFKDLMQQFETRCPQQFKDQAHG